MNQVCRYLLMFIQGEISVIDNKAGEIFQNFLSTYNPEYKKSEIRMTPYEIEIINQEFEICEPQKIEDPRHKSMLVDYIKSLNRLTIKNKMKLINSNIGVFPYRRNTEVQKMRKSALIVVVDINIRFDIYKKLEKYHKFDHYLSMSPEEIALIIKSNVFSYINDGEKMANELTKRFVGTRFELEDLYKNFTTLTSRDGQEKIKIYCECEKIYGGSKKLENLVPGIFQVDMHMNLDERDNLCRYHLISNNFMMFLRYFYSNTIIKVVDNSGKCILKYGYQFNSASSIDVTEFEFNKLLKYFPLKDPKVYFYPDFTATAHSILMNYRGKYEPQRTITEACSELIIEDGSKLFSDSRSFFSKRINEIYQCLSNEKYQWCKFEFDIGGYVFTVDNDKNIDLVRYSNHHMKKPVLSYFFLDDLLELHFSEKNNSLDNLNKKIIAKIIDSLLAHEHETLRLEKLPKRKTSKSLIALDCLAYHHFNDEKFQSSLGFYLPNIETLLINDKFGMTSYSKPDSYYVLSKASTIKIDNYTTELDIFIHRYFTIIKVDHRRNHIHFSHDGFLYVKQNQKYTNADIQIQNNLIIDIRLTVFRLAFHGLLSVISATKEGVFVIKNGKQRNVIYFEHIKLAIINHKQFSEQHDLIMKNCVIEVCKKPSMKVQRDHDFSLDIHSWDIQDCIFENNSILMKRFRKLRVINCRNDLRIFKRDDAEIEIINHNGWVIINEHWTMVCKREGAKIRLFNLCDFKANSKRNCLEFENIIFPIDIRIDGRRTLILFKNCIFRRCTRLYIIVENGTMINVFDRLNRAHDINLYEFSCSIDGSRITDVTCKKRIFMRQNSSESD